MMQETVFVHQVSSLDSAKATITELFQKGKYEEISRSIGMHSLMFDPQHTMQDQAQLYRFFLDLVKARIRKNLGSGYSSWLTSFPSLLAKLVAAGTVVTDEASQDVLSSHHSGYGPFRSLEDFYSWALDDRRLTLGQIVQYIERTAKK